MVNYLLLTWEKKTEQAESELGWADDVFREKYVFCSGRRKTGDGASTYSDQWGRVKVNRSAPFFFFFLFSFLFFFSRLLPSPPYHPHTEKQQRGGPRRRRRLGARERSPSTEAGPPEHTAPVGGHGVAGE